MELNIHNVSNYKHVKYTHELQNSWVFFITIELISIDRAILLS